MSTDFEQTASAPRIICPVNAWGASIPKPRDWLVKDWAPAGKVTALSAAGGMGKSLFLQQLLTCVAAGRPFLGLPVNHGQVLGVFTEDDPDELHRRQVDINNALGLTMADLGNARWVSRVADENVLVTYQDGVAQLTALWDVLRTWVIDEFWPLEAIGLDTVADFFPGNENDRSQVTQFLKRGVGGLIAETATSVIVTMHDSKAATDGYSGSTAWPNAVRSLWTITKPEESEDVRADDVRLLTRKKANYSKAGETIEIRWDKGAFVPSSLAGEQDASSQCKAAFLECLELVNENGTAVSTNERGKYAPKLFAKLQRRIGRKRHFTVPEFETAMWSLLQNGRIEMADRTKRQAAHLVITRKNSGDSSAVTH